MRAPVVFDRLTRYPTYIEDPDGLDRIRSGLLEVRDWHDRPPAGIINCNSLARLLDTIEYLRALSAQQVSTPSSSGVEKIEEIGFRTSEKRPACPADCADPVQPISDGAANPSGGSDA